MPYSENPYTTGDIGENYVKYKLSQLGVDAVTIDRAYDLFLKHTKLRRTLLIMLFVWG